MLLVPGLLWLLWVRTRDWRSVAAAVGRDRRGRARRDRDGRVVVRPSTGGASSTRRPRAARRLARHRARHRRAVAAPFHAARALRDRRPILAAWLRSRPGHRRLCGGAGVGVDRLARGANTRRPVCAGSSRSRRSRRSISSTWSRRRSGCRACSACRRSWSSPCCRRRWAGDGRPSTVRCSSRAPSIVALAFGGADTTGGKGLGPRLLLPLFPMLTVAAIAAIREYLRAAVPLERWIGRPGRPPRGGRAVHPRARCRPSLRRAQPGRRVGYDGGEGLAGTDRRLRRHVHRATAHAALFPQGDPARRYARRWRGIWRTGSTRPTSGRSCSSRAIVRPSGWRRCGANRSSSAAASSSSAGHADRHGHRLQRRRARRRRRIIADNRKAHHDYHLLETFEAGVALRRYRGEVDPRRGRQPARQLRPHRGWRGVGLQHPHQPLPQSRLQRSRADAAAQAAAAPLRRSAS